MVVCLSILFTVLISVGVIAYAAETETQEQSDLLAPGEGASALDGKTIIFVGNNYTHSVGVVEYTSGSVTKYTTRSGDKGYFYRFCKANGADVTVVDWTFSSHNLSALFSGETCKGSGHTTGTNHVDNMTNKSFDYVVLQEGNESYTDPEDYYNTVKTAIDLFREANPDVKIIYAIPNAVYTNWNSAWQESIDLIAAEGVTVVDWGGLVTDVYTGRTAVPGATLDYNKQSFIISTSATSVYPNLLTGYIYTTMVYCAITGETAVGQSYNFVKNYTGTYSLATFTKEKYTYDNTDTTDVDESTTNMTEIFNSDADMRGIQQLCDEYLRKASWRNHTVTFLDSDGTIISSQTYREGDTVTIPTPGTKEADENFEYTFVGWDKDVELTCSGDATYVAVYEKTATKEWGTFAPGSNLAALDGKKILFTGCSYTYYGGLIEQSASNVYSQDTRTSKENGYFKRLCTQYDIDVTVTDWVFGAHDLTDIFDGSCAAGSHDGHDHLADLVDRNYDYVVLQEILVPGYTTAEQYYNNIRSIMDIFLLENPNTKFFYSLHNQVYAQTTYGNEWKKHIQMLADDGVAMINWGAAVYDVWTGKTEPLGAELEYNKQSFIVSNSAADGYHPTLLAGYVNLVMTWAAITGETPIGQPVEFVRNCTGKYLGIDTFIELHFKYDDPDTEIDETQTNMAEAMRSDTEMLAFQRLASEYLNKTSWLEYINYKVSFVDADGTVISEGTYHYGDTVDVPDDPVKASDNLYSYVFEGWDKEITECLGDTVYTAVYTSEYVVYTVQFLDKDGEAILTSEYHWGDAVTPPSVADTSDGTYRYVFSGWDKEITACAGNAVYTAQYVSVEEGIVIVWRDYDGSLIEVRSYTAGDAVVIPDEPVKPADNVYTYTFLGWDKEIEDTCSADATYTATYSAEYIEYTVIFKDDNGDIISEATYHWGDEITVPAAPVKESDNVYTYAFLGWDSEVVPCCGNATYTAAYSSAYVIYSITFFDDEGEVILTRTYHWGDTVVIPEDPVKASSGNLVYTFAGWDKEVAACAGSTAYYATFTLANGTFLTKENIESRPAIPSGSVIAYTSLGGDYSFVVTPSYDTCTYSLGEQKPVTFYWNIAEGEVKNINKVVTLASSSVYKYEWKVDGNSWTTVLDNNFSFKAKSTLILENDLTYNFYVEKTEAFDALLDAGVVVMINDSKLTKESATVVKDGATYYVVRVLDIAPTKAANNAISFTVSINGAYGETGVEVITGTASVLDYIKGILTKSTNDKSIELMYAILNYITAAHAYAGTSADAKVAELLGTYTAQYAIADGESQFNKPDGVTKASIFYGATVGWGFEGTKDTELTIVYGNTTKVVTIGESGIVYVDLPAQYFAQGITVNGTTINLKGYYDQLTTEKDKAITEALWNYSYAAAEYAANK